MSDSGTEVSLENLSEEEDIKVHVYSDEDTMTDGSTENLSEKEEMKHKVNETSKESQTDGSEYKTTDLSGNKFLGSETKTTNVNSLSETTLQEHKVTEYVNRRFDLDPSTIYQKNDKSDPKAVKNFLDFDDLLPHIGDFGRYQKIIFLLMVPFETFMVFVYFTQIFITLVPEHHWCYVPELQHLSIKDRFVFYFFYIFP